MSAAQPSSFVQFQIETDLEQLVQWVERSFVNMDAPARERRRARILGGV